jgi:hypothetical protein
MTRAFKMLIGDKSRQADASLEGDAMLRLIMWPANAVCDAMHVEDENERGVVRMLVNMMMLTLVSVVAFAILFGIL